MTCDVLRVVSVDVIFRSQVRLSNKLNIEQSLQLCRAAIESEQPLPPLPPATSGMKMAELLKDWVCASDRKRQWRVVMLGRLKVWV